MREKTSNPLQFELPPEVGQCWNIIKDDLHLHMIGRDIDDYPKGAYYSADRSAPPGKLELLWTSYSGDWSLTQSACSGNERQVLPTGITPLAATVKPSASFDWRSIAAAKSIVLEGISYFIGTGTDTKLWIDPWLNGSPLIHQPSRSHPTAVERNRILYRWNGDIANQILARERGPFRTRVSSLGGIGFYSVLEPFSDLSWERFPISEHPAHWIVGSSGRPVDLLGIRIRKLETQEVACLWLAYCSYGRAVARSLHRGFNATPMTTQSISIN
ncbi:hypothetical protein GBA52_015392 [Prunus armeniaca]|nr:hypothetical protein GBA52_015392 [Prunus armeniaca]